MRTYSEMQVIMAHNWQQWAALCYQAQRAPQSDLLDAPKCSTKSYSASAMYARECLSATRTGARVPSPYWR